MDTNTPGTAGSLVPHSVLSAAAHELRGSLGVARGYLRLLAGQVADNPRARKAVEQASHATERILALADELRDYSRLASGEARLSPASSSLQAILTAAAGRTVLPNQPKVGVIVEMSTDVVVRADPSRLADACSALATALARAQVGDATLVLTLAGGSAPATPIILITVSQWLQSVVEERPPRLDRSGLGLRIATAELSIRLLGGGLMERWGQEGWAGYSVRL